MSVDRKGELALLQTPYESGRPHPVLIYGRRRVDRTWLVKKLLRGVFTFTPRGGLCAISFLGPSRPEGNYYNVLCIERIFREPPLAANGGTADARAGEHCS